MEVFDGDLGIKDFYNALISPAAVLFVAEARTFFQSAIQLAAIEPPFPEVKTHDRA
jgi:hypothetical protein